MSTYHLEKRLRALMDTFSVKGRDYGMPGDTYIVTLHIAGKWRTVAWEKADSKAVADGAVLPCTGKYYFVSSNNGWSFDEMKADGNTFSLDVTLSGADWEKRVKAFPFQIVRNEDWGQVFYPPDALGAQGKDAESVAGPD